MLDINTLLAKVLAFFAVFLTGPKEGLREGPNVNYECADVLHCMRDPSAFSLKRGSAALRCSVCTAKSHTLNEKGSFFRFLSAQTPSQNER